MHENTITFKLTTKDNDCLDTFYLLNEVQHDKNTSYILHIDGNCKDIAQLFSNILRFPCCNLYSNVDHLYSDANHIDKFHFKGKT